MTDLGVPSNYFSKLEKEKEKEKGREDANMLVLMII